ncbi:hypothetical protein NPA07_02230 [Mycoplasmopsis caviae]|uniref:Lipoprotein n=1 Tax=Mycoplasmopsis caviae TaxID=55603 RepID=A0A3P8MEE4_9BACT|nr:hypothetical protein [Mycoplasmopsis caviae]UUD35668.1 hypothetical protein NPA07_02230 [Mycoplasmopsis caviae]VDR41586.1 Uncharacterised protein [Mycoplasmopsis caviae]
MKKLGLLTPFQCISLTVPLVACNCNYKDNKVDINEYASKITVSIKKINTKSIDEINSIDDFDLENFNKNNYSIADYKIEKNFISNNLKLMFKIKDLDNNISNEQARNFDGFKQKINETNTIQEIDSDNSSLKLDVLEKNNKINTSIKSLNDFKILNLDEKKYSIYDLNITYPDSKSIKVHYSVLRQSDFKLSSRKEQKIDGFKDVITPSEAINSLKLSLINPNSNFDEIKSKKINAFAISSYDKSKFKVELADDKLVRNGSLLTARFSLVSLTNPTERVSKDFYFNIITKINQSDLEVFKNLLNYLAKLTKPILLIKNEYADKIIANYESNLFFYFKNLNSSTIAKIRTIEKINTDKIKVSYILVNIEKNISSDEQTEIITLEPKTTSLKSYEEYARQKILPLLTEIINMREKVMQMKPLTYLGLIYLKNIEAQILDNFFNIK